MERKIVNGSPSQDALNIIEQADYDRRTALERLEILENKMLKIKDVINSANHVIEMDDDLTLQTVENYRSFIKIVIQKIEAVFDDIPEQ